MLNVIVMLTALASPQPNILLILVDDLGWRDLSSYHSSLYQTPHIDALATQGLKFNQAYTAAAICSPTRVSILTGQHPARLKVTDWLTGWHYPHEKKSIPRWNTTGLLRENTTIGELLQQRGYRTAWIGKWHAGGHDPKLDLNAKPLQHQTARLHGFDVGSTNYALNGRFNADDPKGVMHLTLETISFIQETQQRKQPWFATLSHYAVHTPVHARKEDAQAFNKIVKSSAAGLLQKNVRYAAMLSALDRSVGHLIDYLKQASLLDNTLVLFYSDNGGLDKNDSNQPTNNAPLRNGKSTLYEGGIRVPFIAYWPAKIKPGESDELISSIDLLPTIAELAQARHNQLTLDGVSLVDLLFKREPLAERALFWHYPHYHRQSGPMSAIRQGRYKLLEKLDSNKLELYDLHQDLSEQHNLADQKPAISKRLLTQLQQWRQQIGAQSMTDNPNYDASKAQY